MKGAREKRIGAAFTAGAFLWWAAVVFYFKAVDHVAPAEVLAHRIVWLVAILVTLLAARGLSGALNTAGRFFGNFSARGAVERSSDRSGPQGSRSWNHRGGRQRE